MRVWDPGPLNRDLQVIEVGIKKYNTKIHAHIGTYGHGGVHSVSSREPQQPDVYKNGCITIADDMNDEEPPPGAALAVEPSEAPEPKKPGLGLGALAKVAGRLKQTDAQKADRDRRRKKRELLRHLKK